MLASDVPPVRPVTGAPFLADLPDLAAEAIIVYDAAGAVQYWNAAAARLYGWPSSTTLGYRLDPLAEGGWLPWEALRTADVWSGVVARRRLDGGLVRAEVRVVVRRAADGAIERFMEFGGLAPPETMPASDLAQLDFEASDASESERSDRFRRLLEYMPIALWQVDARSPGQAFEALRAEGVRDIRSYLERHPELVAFANDTVVVRQVNRAAIELLGGANEEQFLRPVRYIFEATPDASIEVMTRHFEGARTHIQEMKVNTFDGRVLDVLLLVTYPQPPEDLAITFISMVDITDRRRAEAELRQVQADFAHAARVSTLGEMVASIAHEVKQPLGAIVTNGEASLRWLERPDSIDKVIPLLERIVFCANQANEIIRRIQGMASKHATVWSELSIDAIVDEAVQVILYESREKGVEIEMQLTAGDAVVLGDRIQIQQVVVNLIVNGLQAIALQQGPVRKVSVGTASDDERVSVTVADSGPGFDEAEIDHIFDGFFTTKEAGMGMGLTICRSILAAHGGEIAASNRPGGGAEMRFWLPRQGEGAG